MCSATFGASPVSSFTFAASAIFSWTVRGVPGVLKTLNRVPELPKAQDGSSMAWWASWSAMESKEVMKVASLDVLGEIKVAARGIPAETGSGRHGHTELQIGT